MRKGGKMIYRLAADCYCRKCKAEENDWDRCGDIDNIPKKDVWKNIETGELRTLMTDG